MSRPKTPAIWSSSTVNYPATGSAYPWEGHPVIAQPAADYFLPKTAPAAEGMNWALNQATAAAKGIVDYLGQVDVDNWRNSFTWNTVAGGPCSPGYGGPIYDASRSIWIMPTNRSVSSPDSIHFSTDGNTWTQWPGFNAPGPLGFWAFQQLAMIPGGAILSVVGATGAGLGPGSMNLYTLQAGSTTWVLNTLATISGWSTNVPMGDMACTAFKNLFLFCWNLQTPGSPPNMYYTDATGTTVTGASGSFSNTSTFSNAVFVDNGSKCLFQAGKNSVYYTTTDGQHWSAPIALPGSNQNIAAAAWSACDGVAYVLMVNGSGVVSLYTTIDFSAWTLVRTFTSSTPIGIAVNGAMLVLTLYQYGLSTTNRLAYSTDQGATWHLSSLSIGTGPFGRAIFGGNQFIYTDTNYAAASFRTGIIPSTNL